MDDLTSWCLVAIYMLKIYTLSSGLKMSLSILFTVGTQDPLTTIREPVSICVDYFFFSIEVKLILIPVADHSWKKQWSWKQVYSWNKGHTWNFYTIDQETYIYNFKI